MKILREIVSPRNEIMKFAKSVKLRKLEKNTKQEEEANTKMQKHEELELVLKKLEKVKQKLKSKTTLQNMKKVLKKRKITQKGVS